MKGHCTMLPNETNRANMCYKNYFSRNSLRWEHNLRMSQNYIFNQTLHVCTMTQWRIEWQRAQNCLEMNRHELSFSLLSDDSTAIVWTLMCKFLHQIISVVNIYLWHNQVDYSLSKDCILITSHILIHTEKEISLLYCSRIKQPCNSKIGNTVLQ